MRNITMLHADVSREAFSYALGLDAYQYAASININHRRKFRLAVDEMRRL